jgi:NADH-quinone oxidoreductase subunit M
MSGLPHLTLLTLTPLVGALVVAGVPRERAALARGLGLLFSGLALVWAVGAAVRFDVSAAGLQLVERHEWIPSLGVDYFVGVDGLGLLMVLLAALLVPFAQWVAWDWKDRAPLFQALVLGLQAGLFGAFTALNFFHWFLFWELSLVPAFFLIKFWGGPGRSAAATQFFVYTMAGSVALLLSFLALFLATGTMDFMKLAGVAADGGLESAMAGRWVSESWPAGRLVTLIFLGVLFGFGVKVPMVPFHTWLPSTYAEAPSAVTMLLTGVMSKMGVYGLLRVLLPIFGEQVQRWQTPLLGLAVLTVVGGAAAALAQRDMKRVLAYSSVNHLGYCLLAVFAVASGPDARVDHRVAALNGTVLQMFNHGLTAATLFAFVAFFERRTAGRRGLGDFGGLRQVAPVWAGLMGIALFSSVGLPGLNGFVGEFLIFRGVFGLQAGAAVVSVAGLLLTAVVLLGLMQRVFHGPLGGGSRGFADLTVSERWTVGPAIALIILLGVMPQWVVGWCNRTVVAWAEAWPW